MAVSTPAQSVRRLASIELLRRFPGYYHLQNVLVRGEFVEAGQGFVLRADERTLDVMLADGVRTTTGTVDVRAQLIDVGRLEPGDPRLAGHAAARDPERWPRPGELLLLAVTALEPAGPAATASIRLLALEPWRFEGQVVTVVGQFRGRNLFGDLPSAPAKSTYDFVLRSGDGAVWVTGLRPRGRGFNLDVDARVDTSQWLEVTGTVKRERSLVTLEGARLTTTAARRDTPTEEPQAPPRVPTPVEVVFSSPSPGETDVSASGTVRVQFSRGLDPASIPSGLDVGYVGETAGAAVEFRTSYDLATRAIEIRFSQALVPLRRIRVATRDTLKGFDGAPVTPWEMTFALGN